ncbi:MAG: M28 family peptidase [bacterium]
MNEFKLKELVSQILKFSPRQGENEARTAQFITFILGQHGVPCSAQRFFTYLPKLKKVVLTADGKNIPCESTSFTGGKIVGKENIFSSLLDTQISPCLSNINFNPNCEEISLVDSYFAPSLAIKAKDLVKVLAASKVEGEIKVSPLKHQSMNILVGNKVNPKFILFAHYDSIKTGATDNASGVAVMMKMIISSPETLQNSLYVFSGNEELSYDKPVYWGRGFRVLEKRLPQAFEKSKEIIVIDCVGNGKTNFSQDKKWLYLGFPIKNMEKYSHKIYFVFGDMEKLMKVYHSDADTIDQLEEKYLDEAVKKTLAKMKA